MCTTCNHVDGCTCNGAGTCEACKAAACTCDGAGTCEVCKSECTCDGAGTCEACTK